MSRTARTILGLSVVGLVLSACTGPAGTPVGASSASSSLATPSTTTPAVSTTDALEVTPVARSCYQLTFDDLAQPSNASPVVDCSGPHTAVTVAVLQNRNPEQVEKINAACTKAVQTYLGATKLQMATTMARAVWFLPQTAGDGWVRCDLVLYAAAGTLAPLPQQARNLYKRDPASIGTCSPTAPGTKKFERLLCGGDTPWRVLVALAVAGNAYPGANALRTQADFRCSDAVRLAKNLPLTYTYGYEWPTKDQWKAGNHNLLCWTTD